MSHSRSTYLTSDLPNHSISRLSLSSPSPLRSAVTFRSQTPTQTPLSSSLKQRQYSALDPKPALGEYTRYFAEHTPSQSVHDTTTSSGGTSSAFSASKSFADTHTRAHTASHMASHTHTPTHTHTQTQGSVISAFRDLQAKVKVIEQERFDALRERDALRAMLLDQRRAHHVAHSRHEMETTESLVALQSTHERLRRESDTTLARLRAAEEIQLSLQRKQQSQQAMHASLQSELARNREQYVSLEKHLLSLKRELTETDVRYERVEETAVYASPTKNNQQRSLIAVEIDAVEQKTLAMRAKHAKLAGKVSSIESYINLLIKINGELCETLHAREVAKRRLLHMSRSLSPPPRYAWPKEVNYGGVMHAINEAARATAQAAVESTALHATEQALKTVVRALSPSPRRRGASFSAVDSDEEEQEEERVRSTPHSRRARSPFNSSLNAGMSSLSLRSGNDADSSLRRKIVFEDEVARSEADDRDLGGDNDDDALSVASLSSSSSASFSQRKTAKKTKKKKVKSKSKSSAPSSPTLGTTSNRQRTLKTVLARQGAITSATRLAAAAQAASAAIKVASHASTQSSQARSQSRSSSAPRARADFIPASGPKSSEFNVVASVSKASRAANTLNATIASRVKSLHSGGTGNLFDEVPRVELMDMQHQLAAVKKMRESLSSLH